MIELLNQFALPLPSERGGERLKNEILMFPIPQFTEGSLYILPCGKSVGEGGERGFNDMKKKKLIIISMLASAFLLVSASRGNSSLLCAGFVVASLVAEPKLQDTWAREWQCTGLVAPPHVVSPRTRDQTDVPCITRQILNH